jgi:hypothetical protein
MRELFWKIGNQFFGLEKFQKKYQSLSKLRQIKMKLLEVKFPMHTIVCGKCVPLCNSCVATIAQQKPPLARGKFHGVTMA